MLIVIETIPPPFHVDESAKEIPARQFPVDGVPEVEVEVLVWLDEEEVAVVEVEVEVEVEVLAWLGVTGADEVLVVAVVAVELELAAETADPAEHWLVPHWQVAAFAQVAEPPPPQGT